MSENREQKGSGGRDHTYRRVAPMPAADGAIPSTSRSGQPNEPNTEPVAERGAVFWQRRHLDSVKNGARSPIFDVQLQVKEPNGAPPKWKVKNLLEKSSDRQQQMIYAIFKKMYDYSTTFSSQEDQAIVLWVLQEENHNVNDIDVWVRLQYQFPRMCGTARSWGTLRAHYVDKILPRFSSVCLESTQNPAGNTLSFLSSLEEHPTTARAKELAVNTDCKVGLFGGNLESDTSVLSSVVSSSVQPNQSSLPTQGIQITSNEHRFFIRISIDVSSLGEKFRMGVHVVIMAERALFYPLGSFMGCPMYDTCVALARMDVTSSSTAGVENVDSRAAHIATAEQDIRHERARRAELARRQAEAEKAAKAKRESEARRAAEARWAAGASRATEVRRADEAKRAAEARSAAVANWVDATRKISTVKNSGWLRRLEVAHRATSNVGAPQGGCVKLPAKPACGANAASTSAGTAAAYAVRAAANAARAAGTAAANVARAAGSAVANVARAVPGIVDDSGSGSSNRQTVTAIWHDWSHLDRFLLQRPSKRARHARARCLNMDPEQPPPVRNWRVNPSSRLRRRLFESSDDQSDESSNESSNEPSNGPSN